MAIDLDDLFAYKTFKFVLVRDRRLGLLYYVFALVIMVYVIYSIISDQLYLRKDPVIAGNVHINVTKPAQFSKAYDYCTAFRPCTYLSVPEISPPMEKTSVFLTTMVSKRKKATSPAGCTSSNLDFTDKADCMVDFEPVTNENSRFVYGIEDYIINLEHVVKVNADSEVFSNKDMKGEVLLSKNKDFLDAKYKNREELYVYLPNDSSEDLKKSELAALKDDSSSLKIREKNVNSDILTVKDLLNAAGIKDLEVLSTTGNGEKTLRQTGVSLIVYIDYSNRMSQLNSFKYKYKVSYITGVEKNVATLSQQIVTPGSDATLYLKNGVSITFVQSGTLGAFDLMSLMRNLVASIALLSLAQLFVEILMLYVLPNKDLYHQYKFQKTDDFSDLRENMQKQRQMSQQKA